MGSANPLKKIEKAITTAASQTTTELGRAGEQATKAGTSTLAAASDPGAWLGYAVNPTVGLGLGTKKAEETYKAMSRAEKDKADAEAQAVMAMEQERQAKLAQEKMVSDKAKAEANKAKERAKRLGQGRRGLLYQGRETGVSGKSNVLGG